VSVAEDIEDARSARELRLVYRGLSLEYATLGWNVVGSVVVLAAAVLARSVALAGFGLDSLIEIVASLVVVWQLKGGDKRREERALRIIGVAFLLLAVYVAAQSSFVLANRFPPAPLANGDRLARAHGVGDVRPRQR